MKYKVNDLIMWHDSRSCYRISSVDRKNNEYTLKVVWTTFDPKVNDKSYRTRVEDTEFYSRPTTEEELFRLRLEI